MLMPACRLSMSLPFTPARFDDDDDVRCLFAVDAQMRIAAMPICHTMFRFFLHYALITPCAAMLPVTTCLMLRALFFRLFRFRRHFSPHFRLCHFRHGHIYIAAFFFSLLLPVPLNPTIYCCCHTLAMPLITPCYCHAFAIFMLFQHAMLSAFFDFFSPFAARRHSTLDALHADDLRCLPPAAITLPP